MIDFISARPVLWPTRELFLELGHLPLHFAASPDALLTMKVASAGVT
jgi:hypothetical protein